MSKYVDALRSDSPASLYVFNQATPANVIDQGRLGLDLSLIESGVTAKAVPSLIPGEHWSVYTPVAYDFDGALPANNYAAYKNWSFTDWEDFYNLDGDFTVEASFITGYSTRSQGAGPVWGFYDGTTGGLWLEASEVESGWELSLKINLSDGESTLVTHEVDAGERIHTVIIKTERNFTLMVNGFAEGVAKISDDAMLAAGTYNELNVIGDDGVRHSNLAAMGALGLFKRALTQRAVERRASLIEERRGLSNILGGFGALYLESPEKNGRSVLAPELDDLFIGADANLEYTADDKVTIKDSSLASTFTAEKKLHYDLTEIETIGPVYHDYTSTSGANSSVTVEYSFDDITYSTLGTGSDAIPEINQDWAQTAEGTL